MPISFAPATDRDARARGAGVTAVLGPTNTGKTHLAIERMLAHSSGIIGLPLRLLAREVYNRCIERIGADAVALITGEEKIKPPNPRFWVATVEAMPRDLDVAFLAVDEIQLAADFDRRLSISPAYGRFCRWPGATSLPVSVFAELQRSVPACAWLLSPPAPT